MRFYFPILLITVTAHLTALAAPPKLASRKGLLIPGQVFTVADFNKDGKQDIISAIPVPNTTTNTYEISILLGNGTGSFEQGETFNLEGNFYPLAIAAADLNGDGHLDIAVLSTNNSSSSSSLTVLFRKASGFASVSMPVLTAYGMPTNMAIADLNGDGRPDIVVPTASGTEVFYNRGNETFAPPVLANAQPETFVVIADVNNDKHPDLLLNAGIGPLTVLLGDGHGGFTLPISEPSLGGAPQFAVADFNQDGNLDIAALGGYPALVSLAFGNGDGTFQTPETVSLPPSFESGTAIAAGDLNDDGAPDLVVLVEGSNYDSAMLTLFNKGKGRFAIAAADFVQVAGETITLAAIAGTNLDVLISGTNYEALFGQPIAETEIAGLLLNNGKGLFPNNVQGGPDSPTPYLTTGDFNGDGLPDIASISSAGLSILLDNGTAENLFTLEPPVPVSSGPVVAADFDLDDKLDVVVINQSTGELLLGEGNGRFQQGTTAFTLPSGTTAAISADMNGDGKPDIVTDMAVVVLGNGDGTFRAPLTPTSACGGASVAVADFNGDGKPDVLIPCFNGLAIFPGNGDGSLGIPFYLTNNPYVLTATTGDFNGDGIADVVFTSYTNAPIDPGILITVLLGNGDGAFRQTASFEVPGNTFEQNPSLIATDLNGDNYTDLAIVDATDSMVVLVPGNGDGTFGAFYLYGTASNPYYVNCIAAAEFQRPVRPGMPDLVFCSEAGVSLDLNTTR